MRTSSARVRVAGCAVVLGCLAFPMLLRAQTTTTSVIAGIVRDTTGAVMPGVTVEASSPALIDKIRTVVTDGEGQYKIVDLRPGTYSVAFTLPGFGTVRREGVELAAGFTAPVNAELRVGTLEETVTVSGASPIVDVQNSRVQDLLTRGKLDALPTAGNLTDVVKLTLGATGARGDVGGNRGQSVDNSGVSAHGGQIGYVAIEGMRINSPRASGISRRFDLNQMSTQELVLETAGNVAESENGGDNLNIVPKDGGNTFSTTLSFDYAPSGTQSDNLTTELRNRGLTSTNTLD